MLRERLLLLLLSAACTSSPEHDPLGNYVDIQIKSTSREICAGTVAYLDPYIERTFDFLGAKMPEGFIVPVWVVNDPPCAGGSACYVPSEQAVYLRSLDRSDGRASGVVRHELTHAVIDQVWGRSIPFLEEGLAETLGRTVDPLPGAGVLAVKDMLDGSADEVDYVAAARFTRFLIDTRGLDRFKRLFQDKTEASQEAVLGRFATVYGEDFERIEAEYLSAGIPCEYQIDLCNPTEAQQVDSSWSASLAASCDDPDFYGTAGENYVLMATQRTIEILVAGKYELRAPTQVVISSEGAPLRSRIAMTRCGACEAHLVYLPDNAVLDLDAGLYAFEFMPAGDSVLELSLERIDGI